MKFFVAAVLLVAPIYLDSCAEVPELDDVHEQQMARSYAAPGRPSALNVPADPNATERQPVPGE